MKLRAEWRRRHHFAEVAEVLGIDTDQVAACTQGGDDLTVLWSESWPAKDALASHLHRDADGVLRQVGEPRVLVDYWPKLFEHLDRDDAA
jgi:hypothetical protein